MQNYSDCVEQVLDRMTTTESGTFKITRLEESLQAQTWDHDWFATPLARAIARGTADSTRIAIPTESVRLFRVLQPI